MHRTVLGVIVAALWLTLAGCGNDRPAADPSSTAASKESDMTGADHNSGTTSGMDDPPGETGSGSTETPGTTGSH